MSAIPKGPITPGEYLARERRADTRSEYFRGEVFAMAGASEAHTLIKDNLAREVGNQFKERPCKVMTSDMRVKINATGLYTYPDVVMVCGKAEYEDDQVDTLLNPIAIVEVLSDSTEKYDRGVKFRNYQKIATLREYVLVAQNEKLVERYVRQADDNWLLTMIADASGEVAIPSVGIRIPIAEIYRGVTFSETP